MSPTGGTVMLVIPRACPPARKECAVTRSEFEKVYEANYTKALNAARRISGQEAEDGVMDAVVYLLDNLERLDRLTPSYFIQACVNYTRMRVRRNHYDIVTPVGTWNDLDHVERADAAARLGRAYNPSTGKGRDTGDVAVRFSEPPNIVEREGDAQ
jgi:DNA-directed RNA polymerase specialized sigma24 family protein